MNGETQSTQVVVIGGGPGGYAAAFHAADLGLQVTLIDLDQNPGGVCLYRGCIPSKALLHVAKVIREASESKELGLDFGKPQIDLAKLKNWKEQVVGKLTGGLGELSKQRKINYIQGRASFDDAHHLLVQPKSQGNQIRLKFEFCIIATGSRPFLPPALSLESDRLWTSNEALALQEIPSKMLVVGGGYIGLELSTVYSALGSEVHVVEMAPSLLPGVDKDLVRILSKRLEGMLASVRLNTQVLKLEEKDGKMQVSLQNEKGEKSEETYERVLVAIGRKPNSSGLVLNNTSVKVNEKGFIEVDAQRRTSVPHIFAIGDVAGDPMLAHKATHEGIVAAEAIAGKSRVFEPRAIPAVVFTDPEIAWCGLTEAQAKIENREVVVSRFPWAASGRAITLHRTDGVTKIIADPETDAVLGVGIVGPGAGELIAEGVLAMEMGATAADMAMSIHAHPTLSETLMEAAEGVDASPIHIYKPKRA